MSLTRNEWLRMYELAKMIERDADYLYFRNRTVYTRLFEVARELKEKVESVIGQVE